MRLALYIAKKYFFSTRVPNVIHAISGISMLGITVGSFALIVVLSVFNGFEKLVLSLYNSFDSDIRIEASAGKYFDPDTLRITDIKALEQVNALTPVIEENVMLRYNDYQTSGTFKAIDPSYLQHTGVDTMVYFGNPLLQRDKIPYAIIGAGIANQLDLNVYDEFTSLHIYMPRKATGPMLSPDRAFNRKNIIPAGVFAIQQDFDNKYVLIPIDFARELVEESQNVTAYEVNLNTDRRLRQTRNQIQEIVGPGFVVLDRFQQHEAIYRIMRVEKLAVYLILSFILLIAASNLVGALLMLVIEKKKDMAILSSMGAGKSLIRRIFLLKGMMLSVGGALIGITAGTILCWLQIKYGLVPLQGSGTFVIDSYPVAFNAMDFVLVFLTVILLGFLASWVPAINAAKQGKVDNLH